jgi:ABC-type phosphate/phosphonate transport system substrate-binding protein
MYNAVPGAAAAWRALFERVFADAQLDASIVDHAAPAPLEALWNDPELCCAFMCGWPFIRSQVAMQVIAAPVVSLPRYAHLPRYCSEFLVRESSRWTTLEQAFGHRFGWTAPNSQSGFNAPRAHLASFLWGGRRALFREVAGPLGPPLQAIEALRGSEVDLVALDSYFLDLCRHHEPHCLEAIRCVATTPWAPIPLLVAAPTIGGSTVIRLRDHLLRIHRDASYAPLLRDVLLQRFVVPDRSAYRALEAMAEVAAARGYEKIR